MSTLASQTLSVKPAPADPPGKRQASERNAARRRVSRALKLHTLLMRWAQLAADFWELWEQTPGEIFDDELNDWPGNIGRMHDTMEDIQMAVALAYTAAAVGKPRPF